MEGGQAGKGTEALLRAVAGPDVVAAGEEETGAAEDEKAVQTLQYSSHGT